VIWPSGLVFVPPNIDPPQTGACSSSPSSAIQFPADFDTRWGNDIMILSNTFVFDHKSQGDTQNKLELVRRYLEQRYAGLGVQTFRVDATNYNFLPITGSNVIAVIPGLDPTLSPVLLCDHYDTAFAEDIYDETGQRVSVPGADDNLSATATLLEAAEILVSIKPRRTTWLVHLTGEEYPSDGSGTRALDNYLLKTLKNGVRAIVVCDMLSWRQPNDPVMQVNAGPDLDSLEIAGCALNASMALLGMTPVKLQAELRTRWDKYSYYYNTDAVEYSFSGWPTILINEHINYYENFDRPYYHESTDTYVNLDTLYGTSVARVAIQTVAQLTK